MPDIPRNALPEFNGAMTANEALYAPFLREILALHSRLGRGDSLDAADTSRFLSLRKLEDLIDNSGGISDDRFYQRQGFKNGRNGFIKAHKEVTAALLPNIFAKLREATQQKLPEAYNFFPMLIDAIRESALPTTYPPHPKLLSGLGCNDAKDFSDIFNAHVDVYVTQSLRNIADRNYLTHVPKDSVFAEDASSNSTLNFIFGYAHEEEFWNTALAIELSGIDFDEKDWAEGILIGEMASPDFSLDLGGN